MIRRSPTKKMDPDDASDWFNKNFGASFQQNSPKKYPLGEYHFVAAQPLP